MANKEMITMKGPYQIASQFAPRPREIKQIAYSVPKAQGIDPALMAAKAANGANRSKELLDALMNNGKQVAGAMQSFEKTAQDEVTRLIEQQKMSPEEFGRFGDASRLPFQWNPIAMKLYNRDVGNQLLGQHFNAAQAEVSNRPGIFEKTEEEYGQLLKEETIKRAVAAGLDAGNETQLKAFSAGFTSLAVKGNAQFIQQKSQMLREDAYKKGVANAVPRLAAVPADDTLGIFSTFQALGDEAKSIGGLHYDQWAENVFKRLSDEGRLEHLAALKDVTLSDGKTKLVDMLPGGWANLEHAASSNAARLGDGEITSYKIELNDFIRDIKDPSKEFSTVGAAQKFTDLMSRVPASMRSQVAQFDAHYKDAMAYRAKKQAALQFESNKLQMAQNFTTQLTKGLIDNPLEPHVFEDRELGIRDINGNAPVFTAEAQRKSAGRYLEQAAHSLVSQIAGSTPESVGGLIDQMSNLLRVADVNGLKGASGSIIAPAIKAYHSALQRPDVLQHYSVNRQLPDGLKKSYMFLSTTIRRNPGVISDEDKERIGPAMAMEDVLGLEPVEAMAMQMEALSVNARPDPKDKKNNVDAIIDDVALGLSAGQVQAARTAVEARLQAGVTPKQIKEELKTGKGRFVDLSGAGVAGRVKSEVFAKQQGYQDFEQNMQTILTASIQRKLGEGFKQGSPTSISVSGDRFMVRHGAKPAIFIPFYKVQQDLDTMEEQRRDRQLKDARESDERSKGTLGKAVSDFLDEKNAEDRERLKSMKAKKKVVAKDVITPALVKGYEALESASRKGIRPSGIPLTD
ncbi:hypothetical protein [Chromobacterium haemolyticum]|uniref:hypothetical protein n=1 Tax=Chromobacterium haemolyticum TaxID=394935 RepID=UPI000D32042F|nr:hypothetical protein [Chromobacterium haemolyticum]PTU68625.1 hypothetical protein DBB33_03785 [Chromobacterium haemolyticum]